MDVAIAPSREAQLREALVELDEGNGPRNDEVCVERCIGATRIDVRAGATGENRVDPGAPERITHRYSHIRQR
jgi:hypothetical protein